MNINLHIERLILDGLPLAHAQGPLVQAAVEAELSRLLSAGGLHSSLQSGIAVPSVRADAVSLNTGSNPQQIGQQIARAVYGGIGQ